MPKLSICIPVFNRVYELNRLLKSLQNEHNRTDVLKFVEIIISDNASTDGTELIYIKAKQRLPNVRWTRSCENKGFAWNVSKAVEQSSAPYVWLMSSDDWIVPEAIAIVLGELARNYDVIIGNPITDKKERRFFKIPYAKSMNLCNAQDFQKFLLLCTEFSAAFAFMSTLIVKKSLWIAADLTPFDVFHPYAHKLRILRGLEKIGGTVRCLNKPLVFTGKSCNEWNRSALPHLELDVNTAKYASTFFRGYTAATKMIYGKILRRQYTTIDILKARIEATPRQWSSLQGTLTSYGYNKIILKKTPLDPALRKMYFQIKKLKRLCKTMSKNNKNKQLC